MIPLKMVKGNEKVSSQKSGGGFFGSGAARPKIPTFPLFIVMIHEK